MFQGFCLLRRYPCSHPLQAAALLCSLYREPQRNNSQEGLSGVTHLFFFPHCRPSSSVKCGRRALCTPGSLGTGRGKDKRGATKEICPYRNKRGARKQVQGSPPPCCAISSCRRKFPKEVRLEGGESKGGNSNRREKEQSLSHTVQWTCVEKG